MTPRAVILAGGYGTRMRPLTERRPKPLLPVGDTPLVGHQLRLLAALGIEEVVLATSYRAEDFRPVLGSGEAYGVELRYATEVTPLGTGGALRKAVDALGPGDGPVLVLNGDLLTEHDVAAQLAHHDRSGALATIHVRHVADARPYGLVEVDGSRAVSFQEKPTALTAGLINAGTYVVDPRLVTDLPEGRVVSLERDVLPHVVSEGRVSVYREEAYFADVGSPSSLLAANRRWAAARGEESVVLSHDVAAGATIHESLVLPGAVIEQGAHLERCVVASGCRVGADAHLTACVLGDDARVGSGARLVDACLDVGERR